MSCALQETDGEQYEMNDGSSSRLYPIDGIHDGLICPTEEELATLRRVGDAIPWTAHLIAIVELAVRTTALVSFSLISSNIHFLWVHILVPGYSMVSLGPLGEASMRPPESRRFTNSGAALLHLQVHTSQTSIWGRFNTICVAVVIALLGHIILIVTAVPGVIEHPDTALAIFLVALFIMGVGTGLFKANISPLVAEQYRRTKPFVVTTPSGEQVIVDPALTVSRIYMYFYLMINLGSLLGQTLMTYSEKASQPEHYVRSPPSGSVFATFVRLLRFACRGRWSVNPLRTWRNLTAPDFWDAAKPSRISPAVRPLWMTFDDQWVDEVRRGLGACAVFAWFPIYWLTANQLSNNLTSQAATLTTNGMPNDFLSNLDPLVLVLCIPLCDFFVCHLHLSHLTPRLLTWFAAVPRSSEVENPIHLTQTHHNGIPCGQDPPSFLLFSVLIDIYAGATAMIWAAILQHRIYQTSPCGHAAATCTDSAGNHRVSPLNVWIQAPVYILIALSEIFAAITGYEYAFSKAPENMRSLMMALYMGTGAMSAILAEGFLWLAADPLLVWNYAVMGTLAGCGGCAFWLAVRHLDAREDEEMARIADDREE
ncbi:putative peptide transporter ptr2 [Mycena sanguinolenta]|uniref:Putative peptide transporter ptr2 n=1 Tax=Mycena sanguinolenta TaxID=230812 RepID=A0A8H6TW32_9AGAR|nr:putative peptide transporter ptr2 [Mycena sanguinolenta]